MSQPKPEQNDNVTTLVVEYPNDVFDPSIQGVAPITTEGTRVSNQLVEQVINTAMVYGVSVVAAPNS